MRERAFGQWWCIKVNFTCPYCNRATTITEPNNSEQAYEIGTKESIHSRVTLGHTAIACPNSECKKLTLKVNLSEYRWNGASWKIGTEIGNWSLLPMSQSKPQPDYIPAALREDYDEACAVLPHSAKASATLSRRCLQGIVRDFWDIPAGKRGNLGAELSFIKDKIEEDTWEGIQAIRSVGDIGAHMEKDVNFVVDVDPEESSLLIELIEMLFEDWYIQRHKRKERSTRAKALAEKKNKERKDAKLASKTAEAAKKVTE